MKRCVRRGDPKRRRYWEELVRRWQKSGQTVRAFCLAEGLQESAFYSWKRKIGQSGRKVSTTRRPLQKAVPSFLPVQVVAAHANEAARGVEIVLAQGRVVRVVPGFDRQTLADVLSLLESRPC